MNKASASPAKETSAPKRVLVWDAPVRVFHWLLVLCFAGAYLTAESERWRLLHITLGYTLGGLVVFRFIWGVLGTRYARFANFVRPPAAIFAYLRSLLRGQPQHFLGHNPAGALAVIGLLLLALLVTASGWAVYNETGGAWLEELHEIAANLMLALVGVHIAGVVASSFLHRENLVGAMFTGRKLAAPSDGIRRSWSSLAALMLAAVLGFWWTQWQSAPAQQVAAKQHTEAHDRHNE